MKLVTLKELLKQPLGTVYADHISDELPCYDPQLNVFCGTVGSSDRDFCYYSLYSDNVNGLANSERWVEQAEKLAAGEEVQITSRHTSRWGLGEEDAKFVIFSKEDVMVIISDLANSLIGMLSGNYSTDNTPVVVIAEDVIVTLPDDPEGKLLRDAMVAAVQFTNVAQ